MGTENHVEMPVIRDPKDFDTSTGSLLERMVFNHRPLFLLFIVVMTALLGYMAATRLEMRPSFEKMIPQSHPYIKNFLENRDQLRGLGNSVRVVVETTDGDIYDKDYLQTLQEINDELFLTPGVDRAWQKSLWSPNVRWTQVTEKGFEGGPVMPDTYDGSQASIDDLKLNVARAGLGGQLVAGNLKSSMIIVPLLDKDSATGQGINYYEFARVLEDNLRQ